MWKNWHKHIISAEALRNAEDTVCNAWCHGSNQTFGGNHMVDITVRQKKMNEAKLSVPPDGVVRCLERTERN